MTIEESEFFDERYDEVLAEDEQTAVVVFGHDTFADFQLEAYREQNEWELDVVSIWEGKLQANFERAAGALPYYCETCARKFSEEELEEDGYGHVCPECGGLFVVEL